MSAIMGVDPGGRVAGNRSFPKIWSGGIRYTNIDLPEVSVHMIL